MSRNAAATGWQAMAGKLKSPELVRFDSVIESLYEAALQPDLIPNALHAYARACNGTVGVIIGIADHQGRVIISPDGKDGAEAYATEWWKHDFVTERSEARKLSGFVTDLDLSSEEERASHPFFQEFGRQYDMFWLCGHVVRRPGVAPLSISVRRPEELGPFLRDEVIELAPLARHAVRAFDIAAKLADAASQAGALCEALTNLGYGIIGLGDTGRILFCNPIAESLSTDGLRLAGGAVLAANVHDQRAVDVLISESLALATGQSAMPPRPVALRRPSGRVPAVLYGIPLNERHADFLTLLGGRAKALLVVIEPDAPRQLDEELLRLLFGFSPGEARLAAAIATGDTINDAAAKFCLSEATLRTTLKNVFQKAGVSRQAELVFRLAPLLRPT
jgi:DNA-binding CsgD family transcriptional regulator